MPGAHELKALYGAGGTHRHLAVAKLRFALWSSGGVVHKAAAALGTHYTTVSRWMTAWGLRRFGDLRAQVVGTYTRQALQEARQRPIAWQGDGDPERRAEEAESLQELWDEAEAVLLAYHLDAVEIELGRVVIPDRSI